MKRDSSTRLVALLKMTAMCQSVVPSATQCVSSYRLFLIHPNHPGRRRSQWPDCVQNMNLHVHVEQDAYVKKWSLCGKPYKQVKGHIYADCQQQTAVPRDSVKDKLLKRNAFVNCPECGTFTIVYRRVSQAAACVVTTRLMWWTLSISSLARKPTPCPWFKTKTIVISDLKIWVFGEDASCLST